MCSARIDYSRMFQRLSNQSTNQPIHPFIFTTATPPPSSYSLYIKSPPPTDFCLNLRCACSWLYLYICIYIYVYICMVIDFVCINIGLDPALGAYYRCLTHDSESFLVPQEDRSSCATRRQVFLCHKRTCPGPPEFQKTPFS